MKKLLLTVALLAAPSAWGACTGSSPTWTTTPDSASVQTCITNATAGDTINISAGTATWVGANAVVLAKAITLKGSGPASAPTTIINLDGSTTQIFHIVKQTTGVTRIQNIKWSVTDSGAKATPHAVVFDGPWPSGQSIVFTNNVIQLSSSDFSTIATPGGVVMANNVIHGTIVGDTLAAMKLPSDNTSWTTTGSLGTLDTTGFINIYIETNTFDGGANATDCDDECRVVFRYNIGQDGATFNSHGADTSPQGMRQFEIYNNNWTLPDKTCPGGAVTSPSNINQWIWIRGGSGVIYNNQFEPLVTSCWGTKPNVKLANRGAENNFRPNPPITTCSQVVYPAYHQLGQNDNGSALFTDPIWFWGNTTLDSSRKPNGLFIDISNGWEFGNNCNFNWNTFFQWGRDAVNTSLPLPITNPPGGGEQEGQGGTPKPGYTAFAYPHPLVGPSSAPLLSFTPTAVGFGSVTVASSVSQTLTITNVGTATQTFTSIVLTPSQFTNGNTGLGGQCPASGTILQGANCTVKVVFQPSAATSYSGTLTMNGTVTAAVSLTGSGTASIAVPSIPTLTLASITGATANLSWTASTGNPTGYNVLRSTTTGTEVVVATLGNVTTYADASLANATYFWKVNAFNTAGTSANSNEVTGAISTACSINLTPSLLTLPNTTVGVTSASSPFTLTNNGTASCTSVSVANPTGSNAADFGQSNACPGTLTVAAHCDVNVTFSPSIVGVESAAIVVTSSDPNSPDTELLQGTGIQAINVSPLSLDFGRVQNNKTSASQTVTITNNSGGAIVISAAITGGDSSQFTKGTDTCSGSIANLATCTTAVTMTPTSNGAKASTLVFTYTGGPGSPINVPLTGTTVSHKVKKGVII